MQLYDSRIFVRGLKEPAAATERLRRVFGVHAVCPAIEMDKDDFEALCDAAAGMMENLTGTFKVRARRADKRYSLIPRDQRPDGRPDLERYPQLRWTCMSGACVECGNTGSGPALCA